MITNHKFRNLCGGECESFSHETDNMCSAFIAEDSYRQCFKTRVEHAEVEEWAQLKPRQ